MFAILESTTMVFKCTSYAILDQPIKQFVNLGEHYVEFYDQEMKRIRVSLANTLEDNEQLRQEIRNLKNGNVNGFYKLNLQEINQLIRIL